MNLATASALFKKIDELSVEKRPTGTVYAISDKPVLEYDRRTASQWVTMARTAIESVLPRGHAIVRQFDDALEDTDFCEEDVFEELRGIVRGARHMLDDGHLSSIVDGIRADTETELLDQAESLLSANHRVAAAVLAGGSLETHLLGLCTKNTLSWSGTGSISKYDGAIAQARNKGTVIYSASDSKSVTAWGGIRNDAAHEPTSFVHSSEAVQLMIRGIREFIARVT